MAAGGEGIACRRHDRDHFRNWPPPADDGGADRSLPLVSVLGMIFLWHARPDSENMAVHAQATFWYVLPSLPMFVLIPALLRGGMNIWAALALGCLLTIALYLLMMQVGPRLGLRLWP